MNKSYSKFIINKKALIDNAKKFKKNYKNVKLCAVIKANAYGLGLKTVVKLLNNTADFYAVACFKEAILARKFSEKGILILGIAKSDVIPICAEKNISITISNNAQLTEVINKLKNCKQKLKIHLAVNSGMNRLGYKSNREFLKALNLIKKCSSLCLEGIYSHLKSGNIPAICTQQMNNFYKIIGDTDISNVLIHICASSGMVFNPEYHFNMCRLGISLYGANEPNEKLEFKPVLNISSEIVEIQNVNADDFVGYGFDFQASRKMKVAIVPLGYADGIFRKNSNRGRVIINGEFCNIIGNVCMDMMFVDVSNINVNIGTKVTILGNNQGKSITIFDIAKICDTIPYEILTNFKYQRMDYVIK